MSEILRRFVFGKHHAMAALELRHDKGTAASELVTSWDRDTVDRANEAQSKPDPGAIDVVAELLAEAQQYTDALGAGSVMFKIQAVKADGAVIHSRPHRVHPSPDAARPNGGRATVDAEAFDKVVQALLKSNAHVVESSQAVSEGAARLVKAQAEVCEALAKLVTAGVAPEPVTARVLTDEEREELIQRTALVKQAAGKLPDLIELGIALAAKFAKLPTVDAAPEALSNGVVTS